MKYASGIALSLRNEMITKLSQSEKKDYRSRYAALSDEVVCSNLVIEKSKMREGPWQACFW